MTNFFDWRIIRMIPNVSVFGWGIYRIGWNFRPDWDESLKQPWFGKWWVHLGPYVIGRISD